MGNGMVKIVTGIRRCGKSFLLFNLFRNHLLQNGVREDHIIGLSLDDLRNSELRNPIKLLDYIESKLQNDGTTHYVILDEVQLVDRFVEVLLSLMHLPNLEIYVSGSNSKFLSSDIVTEFRGRGDEIRVYPLTMSELMEEMKADFILRSNCISDMEVYPKLYYKETNISVKSFYELCMTPPICVM
jgi:predicted AAA+ superfamily ATPase